MGNDTNNGELTCAPNESYSHARRTNLITMVRTAHGLHARQASEGAFGRSAKKSIDVWPLRWWVQAGASSSWWIGRM